MGDYEGGERAARRSLEHARLAGDRAAERAALAALTTVVWGPMPVTDGLSRLNEIEALAGEDRLIGCNIARARGSLGAMAGTLRGGRDSWVRAHAVAWDLGLVDEIGFVGQEGWLIETLAGDHEAAERIAREAFEFLDRAGAHAMRNVASDQLGHSLAELGRLD